MKTIAIIVAGGMGQRFDSKIPKQYTYSILTKTITKFLSSKLIDAVQVVIRSDDIELYKKCTEGMNLLPVAFGGKTRSDSVQNGLQAISEYDPELVLIHDANRPFLSVKLIEQIIEQLTNHPKCGVVPSLPINETVKRVANKKTELIDRNNLISIQTPQGFYYKQIFEISKKNNKLFTDESTLAEHYDIPIIYIPGEKKNIKITYQEEITMQYEIRTGLGFDAHKFSPDISANNTIILGGIKIPFEKKLEAHSDGDVLIHALVDAILGSIACGDIGMHFPPSDPKWKDANSKDFLIHANKLLLEKGGKINNIDITVICEKPHLSQYKEQIQHNLAQILSIEENRVSIKATTTEKMGFTGREEGIAVQAIVTISLF